MTPQEWLKNEVNTPGKYDGQPAVRIAAYLNVRPSTKTPSAGTVTEPLTADEVMAIIKAENPSEWVTITAPTARWSDAKAKAVDLGYADALNIDAAIIRLHGTSDLSSETVVLDVINANDLALSQAMITTLALAGLLSKKTANALQTAMKKPAPSAWTWGRSIAETATGIDDYLVTVADVEAALA